MKGTTRNVLALPGQLGSVTKDKFERLISRGVTDDTLGHPGTDLPNTLDLKSFPGEILCKLVFLGQSSLAALCDCVCVSLLTREPVPLVKGFAWSKKEAALSVQRGWGCSCLG